jgi:hypothetical protein
LNVFGIRIAKSEIRDGFRNRAFHDVILDVAEEPSHKLDNLQNKGDGELRSIITMLDQVVVHQIGRKTCELRQNFVQQILKKEKLSNHRHL